MYAKNEGDKMAFFGLFGFNEEGMKKKLEKLRAAVERKPVQVAKFEGVLATYQDKIARNSDKIENQQEMKARVQAVQLAISRAKKMKPKKTLKKAA